MTITRKTIEESVEAALTKIRCFNPGAPLPIPVGPDLPVISNVEVLDHDDIEVFIIRYISTYKGEARYNVLTCEGIEFLYDPEFWVGELDSLTKSEED